MKSKLSYRVALLIIFLMSLAVISIPASAETTDAPQTPNPQALRMKACAAEYHKENLAKDQYKDFMKKCLKKDSDILSKATTEATQSGGAATGAGKDLSTKTTAAVAQVPQATDQAQANVTTAVVSQKDKMKLCNAQATDQKLLGDDRKAFMKTCLSGKK